MTESQTTSRNQSRREDSRFSANRFKEMLKDLRKLSLEEEYPVVFLEVLRDYVHRREEKGLQTQSDLPYVAADVLADIWRREVQNRLEENSPDNYAEWGMALLPIAACNIDQFNFITQPMAEYLDECSRDGKAPKVERDTVISQLRDVEWVAKWVEDQARVEHIVAVASDRALDSSTYDYWFSRGIEILYEEFFGRYSEMSFSGIHPVEASVARDLWAEHPEGDVVYELREELESSDSPFLEVTKRAPQHVVELVIGAPGWKSLLPSMAEIAVEAGRADWAVRMIRAVEKVLEGTWRRTGWMHGTVVIGPILEQVNDQRGRVHQVRGLAENALLGLLPPQEGHWGALHPWGEAVGASLVALIPFSDRTARQLAQELSSIGEQAWGLREIRRRLVNVPWFAQYADMFTDGGQVESWRPKRMKVSLEYALRRLEYVCQCEMTEMELTHLRKIASVLSTVGTDEAARWLGKWLVEYAQGIDAGPYDNDRANRVTAGLMCWEAEEACLFGGVDVVLDPSVPWWVWHGYLRGLMRQGGADAAVYLARLMAEKGWYWTHEQRKEVVWALGGHGDERVIPYLGSWWDQERMRGETTESYLAIWIGETLWGPDGDRGVLVRRSTEWLVDWLEDADVSDEFRERVAIRVLRPRYRVDGKDNKRIVELGRKWLARGAAEANLSLMRAGAYLADKASREELDALEELERGLPQHGRIHLAGRMGMWEIVKSELEDYFENRLGFPWERVELIAEQQYLSILPLLVDHFWDGTDWIADAGLLRFRWQDVDECLDRLWEERDIEIDYKVARKLWRLGTPGAVSRVLSALREGMLPYYPQSSLPKVYREDVWLLLVEFFDEVEDEMMRWQAFSSILGLWPIGKAWPWEVTDFFFSKLDDPDNDIARGALVKLNGFASGWRGCVWEGRAEAYQQGLREIALKGTEQQCDLALLWLNRAAFDEGELSDEDVTVEEIVPARPEEPGRELLRAVCQRESISLDGDVAYDRALDILLKERRYLWPLVKAVQTGKAPEQWLIAAVASQNILLEDKDGQMTVRCGEKSFPVDEWSRL